MSRIYAIGAAWLAPRSARRGGGDAEAGIAGALPTAMRSSWPILVGVITVGFAAFWYDAQNEVAGRAGPGSLDPAAVVASGGHSGDVRELQASTDPTETR